MRAVLISVAVLLAGCAGEIAAPPEQEPEVNSGEWTAGALLAARDLGCQRAVWQLPGETFKEAAAVYAHGYTPGDCLILLPQGSYPTREWLRTREVRPVEETRARVRSEYFLGYAGQFDGDITDDIPSHWPGVPVYYLRDSPVAMRL
jgi:hypothetical protein